MGKQLQNEEVTGKKPAEKERTKGTQRKPHPAV